VLALNPQTGVLSEGANALIQSGNDPTSIAITPNGSYVHVTNSQDGTVALFSVNSTTGLLTSLGNPVPAGAQGPINILVDPGSQIAYVTCIGGNQVSVFSISASGALHQIGNVTTDVSPQGFVLVPR
jgi:6-phosphogluconolactonase